MPRWNSVAMSALRAADDLRGADEAAGLAFVDAVRGATTGVVHRGGGDADLVVDEEGVAGGLADVVGDRVGEGDAGHVRMRPPR